MAGVLKAAALAACLVAVGVAWRRGREPRAWEPAATPVAFWSWRDETPAQADVDAAAEATGARVLFLRAGQLDFSSGRVSRIRAARGRFPTKVALHLVYNATPDLLEEFERVEEGALASAAVGAFLEDAARAAGEGARVEGLQLDIDAPTRLLARYGRVLGAARSLLPEGVRLSATGLPTWMNSARALRETLAAVDFWAPQFYGASVAARSDRVAPVSSPAAVERDVERARELGVPFYAGLATYGQAMLYGRDGRLAGLRGDLDPARVAADQNFELVERRAFEPRATSGADGLTAAHASEWRYVFRARSDAEAAGLSVRAGDTLVLDVPSGEALRAGARGVRRRAGDKLLGICLFRLPTRGDATALNLAQVAAALADREAAVSTRLEAHETEAGQLLLTAANDGAAGALLGDGAVTITLPLPKGGRLRGLTRLEGFDTFETLCAASPSRPPQPCSTARAGFVRLRARAWGVGARASAGLSFEDGAPASLSAHVAVRADDGRLWQRELTVPTRKRRRE
jgi:hypothetical protein